MSASAGWGWPARLGAMLFSGVFMLGFGFGGIWGGVLPIGQTFSSALAARSHVSVPAQVLDTELVRHRGSKGSVSFQVKARYAYRWQGRDFEGQRVGLATTGADNIGNWHELWHQRLKQARETEQPVPAWIDPDRPERALLDRSVRWGLMALHLPFAVLFTGVGLGAAVVFFGALFNRLPDPADRRKKPRPSRATGPAAPARPGGKPAVAALRGSLEGGGEVVFPRRWPRWTGGGMLLVLALWVASGPVESAAGAALAALPATAWTALALHLLTLRWTWRRVGDALEVRRASWLHDRQLTLDRAHLASLDEKVVYTSSTNGGPMVSHPALTARTPAGHTVQLTPALADAEALRAVRKHLQQGMDMPSRRPAARSSSH